MGKIFELFGYRLDSWNAAAQANCARAWCPFMLAACDGGGNRYLSAIDLRTHPELAKKFPGKTVVQAGICSLHIRDNEPPWIVCPRRLLSLRHQVSEHDHQAFIKQQIAQYMHLAPNNTYQVWAEVKMKVGVTSTTNDLKHTSFDYTFDYIIAGSQPILVADAAKIINCSEQVTRKKAEEHGYTLVQRDNLWIEDFPADPIVLVEIMTSSTSGGDKKKRTQIGMAFEDAVLYGNDHQAPGINYRQVWARMVSQLIGKSQVGMAWGGKTIWVIQDVLANYISSSTALNLSHYHSNQPDEVNILALGYGEDFFNEEVFSLQQAQFYSGPIVRGTSTTEKPGGFVDIVKIGTPPPKEYLWRSLFLKATRTPFFVNG